MEGQADAPAIDRPFDRIYTTHVGSLPRPAALLAMMQQSESDRSRRGEAEVLAGELATAVGEVVAKQVATGVDIVSDGEFSKPSYATYVSRRLTGFAGEFRGHVARDLGEYRDLARHLVGIGAVVPSAGGACCRGPVAVADLGGLQADIANLQVALEASQPSGAFMNAASPGVIAMFQKNEFYPTEDAYIEAVSLAMREEYEAIIAAGLQLQIDAPDLAMGRHLAYPDSDETEFLVIAARNVEALNAAVANIPPERMRLHICWGNYAGPHHRDVPLERIIDIVLKARPAYLLIEGANPRHAHEWAVFAEYDFPDDKVLVPGVIDSTSNYIEHPELVAQRICRYAELLGRERVMAGSDCGFSTFREHPTVHPDVVWAKLAALVDGADRASERLW